ncbi:MAG TPA: hypothetical protein VGK94_14920 [Candidatus Polarisedimenticolia bacterium]|jgi:hypothetical protein
MIERRRRGARLSGLVVIATLLAVAASGSIIAKTGSKKATRGQQQSITRAVGSQQVSVDPATGRLQQPTRLESQKLASELSAMLERSIENLNVTNLPDGTTMVDLDGGFQHVAMGSLDTDGEVVLTCVDDPASAEALLQKGVVSRATARDQKKESGKRVAPKRAPVTAEER